jgi:hypothetical protein
LEDKVLRRKLRPDYENFRRERSVHGRIIAEWILKKQDVRLQTGFYRRNKLNVG